MRAALSALPVWAWSIIVLQALWAVMSLLGFAQARKELAAEKDACREDRWQLANARERFERLRLKGILTPETRLPLSERRAEPMPRPVTAPTTPEEAARVLGTLWDVLHLVEEGAPQADVIERLRQTLGQGEGPAAPQGVEALVEALLPAVDALDRAAAVKPVYNEATAIVQGVRKIRDQVLAALESARVTTIEAQGEIFDPQVHHAVERVTSEHGPAGVVARVHQRGLRLGGRLLRPAQVGVTGPAEDKEDRP